MATRQACAGIGAVAFFLPSAQVVDLLRFLNEAMDDQEPRFEVLEQPSGRVLYTGGYEAHAYAARYNDRERIHPIGLTATVHQKCTIGSIKAGKSARRATRKRKKRPRKAG